MSAELRDDRDRAEWLECRSQAIDLITGGEFDGTADPVRFAGELADLLFEDLRKRCGSKS